MAFASFRAIGCPAPETLDEFVA